jgi:putative ABC transport system substrate-binding protein
VTGTDPVALGLVASLNRPGGNLTGVASLVDETGPKRAELVRELLPRPPSLPCFSIRPIRPPTLCQALCRQQRVRLVSLFIFEGRQ